MSLFKGLNRIAGQTAHTATPEDISDKQVVFVDDGNTDGYSDEQEIIDEVASGNMLSNLVASIKKGLQYISNKFSNYYTSTEMDSKLSSKANVNNQTHQTPTLQWYIGDGENNYVQLRRSGSTGSYAVSTVYYNTVEGTNTFYGLTDSNGVFLPDFAYKTASSSSITTSCAASAWTNLRSISLTAGTWLIEAQATISGSGKVLTLRLQSSAGEYGRQTIYSPGSLTYSGHLCRAVTFTATTTVYLSGYSGATLTINEHQLFARRLR